MSRLEPVSFAEVSGWTDDALAQALPAFQRSAQELLTTGHGFQRASRFGGERQDWIDVATAALQASDARSFFETQFQPCRAVAEGPGLFTGYYEPLAQGALRSSARFRFPLYARPPDLVAFTAEEQQASGLSYGRRVAGQPAPYADRRDIETGALQGQGLEICWLESAVDAFFIHIQGNGRVALAEGGEIRLSFAAKNGLAYRSIGKALLERGAGTPQTMSMQFLREWMARNPDQAQGLMWENPSFVFFRKTAIADPALGAIGAGKVNLTPLRSLAVDRAFWAFGTPLFLETHYPPKSPQAGQPIKRLMLAQDTGSAIKGLARGDIYFGWGEVAAMNAGHMKQPGQLTALLPKALAARLAR